MKKIYKVLIIILFVLISSFIILLRSNNVGVKGNLPSVKYNNFFRDINNKNDSFGDISINKIAMLGSHDALSYNIDVSSIPNVNEDNITNNSIVYNLARGLIVRLARTQYHDIYTQLEYGVRLIDARITYINGEYYSSHGVVSHKLKDSILDILRFLDENPGEFIIFLIQHFYNGESNDQMLDDYIASIRYKDKNMYDYINYDIKSINNINELTYNKLTDNGNKAGLLMIANQSNTSYFDYFKLNQINYPCHYEMDSKLIIKEINEWEYKYIEDNKLHINQSQLTPNEDEWYYCITSWSLLKIAEVHNDLLIDQDEFDYWLTYMPIYWCDYTTSTYNDFNNRINIKLMNYNMNLK